MSDTAGDIRPSEVVERLRAMTDVQAVLVGGAAEPYYTDVFRRLQTPLAVVRPADVAALQAVMAFASDQGLAIFPRGGGASYTDGYLPSRPDSLVVDLGRLDRIVEINELDSYVTVEAGVTWAALKTALDSKGLRTPFFGPFSGVAATVGGSVAQNAISHGSGAHGLSAQSVQALEVVTASGELLRTGSAARGAGPFARHYGPDLTGLFTGDCGALGVKVRITLPLLRRKPAFQCASFAFTGFTELAQAMRLAALERLEDEHFAIDAALTQGQLGRQDARSLIAMAGTILASSPTPLKGFGQLLKMAAAGDRALQASKYMFHVIIEGVDDAEAKAKLARLRAVLPKAREIANSLPVIVRGMPFAPLYNTLGPKGERWVPLHGVLAHSQVAGFHTALQALYDQRAGEMQRLGVWSGSMFSNVGSSGLLYEVALYWPGPPSAYHRAALPAEHLASLPVYVEHPDAFGFVADLKTEISDLMDHHGAIHFQLGKSYAYAPLLQPRPLSLLKAVKAELDPKGLMNPGALGL